MEETAADLRMSLVQQVGDRELFLKARVGLSKGFGCGLVKNGPDTIDRKLSSRMRQFLLQIKLYWIACVWASFGGLIQTA
jgi:hypothetical protein